MYTLPEIGFPLLDQAPVEAVGAPNPVEAFELIRLSIWANADEAPKASTDASATVAKFMLFPEATDTVARKTKARAVHILQTHCANYRIKAPTVRLFRYSRYVGCKSEVPLCSIH